MINLFIRLFIISWCFAFALADNPIIIMRDIGFENRDIKFDTSYCDGGVCKNNGSYSYLMNDELKNNMKILIYKALTDKANDKVFIKMNGIRVLRGDEVISKYHKGIGLFKGDYSDYASYKKVFLRYLDKIKNPINDAIMEYSYHNPLIYNVYFPEIKASIITTKTQANNNLFFYDTKMNVFFDLVIMTSDLSGDKYNQSIIKVNKLASSDFEVPKNKDGWDSMFYDLMKDVSNTLSYSLVNASSEKNADKEYPIINNEDNELMPTFRGDINGDVFHDKSSHFFTLGISSVPIKTSLGLEYEASNDYSHYFNSFSFGYNRNMIDWYDISINANINIGKKDYFIIDENYAFKQPDFLSLNAVLSKRIYFNSNIYIAPLLGGSFSRISSSKVKGFKNSSYFQDYSILLGGEIGFSGNNHEISLWVKKSVKSDSKFIDGDTVYKATMSSGVSFGLSYGYSF